MLSWWWGRGPWTGRALHSHDNYLFTMWIQCFIDLNVVEFMPITLLFLISSNTMKRFCAYFHNNVTLKKFSPGSQFNIKMSYQYRKSHRGVKTVIRSSYLHNIFILNLALVPLRKVIPHLIRFGIHPLTIHGTGWYHIPLPGELGYCGWQLVISQVNWVAMKNICKENPLKLNFA